MVEKDEPGEGTEELELSFRSTGTSQKSLASLVPRVLVSMRQEDQVWKLAEIGFSMKVKLDAALLDALTSHSAKPVTTTSTRPEDSPKETAAVLINNEERAAFDAVRSLVSAEEAYKIAFPSGGYTCSLAALGGKADGNASEDRAGLIDARLESGMVNGYRISLLGCRGEPIVGYKIMAVPEGAGRYGKKAFCADESAVVRFSDDGRGITCLSERNILK